ncbi:hypothetical protein C8R46DRAFT_656588 [Mycena filopes]|nr:hypothetical protein C8R46DRAFT_656588 [Mycena filopes]
MTTCGPLHRSVGSTTCMYPHATSPSQTRSCRSVRATYFTLKEDEDREDRAWRYHWVVKQAGGAAAVTEDIAQQIGRQTDTTGVGVMMFSSSRADDHSSRSLIGVIHVPLIRLPSVLSKMDSIFHNNTDIILRRCALGEQTCVCIKPGAHDKGAHHPPGTLQPQECRHMKIHGATQKISPKPSNPARRVEELSGRPQSDAPSSIL